MNPKLEIELKRPNIDERSCFLLMSARYVLLNDWLCLNKPKNRDNFTSFYDIHLIFTDDYKNSLCILHVSKFHSVDVGSTKVRMLLKVVNKGLQC